MTTPPAAGAGAASDTWVERAMRSYDTLTPSEQREVFRALCQSVIAWRRALDASYLIRFAESIEGMVYHESCPGFQQARRAKPALPAPGEGASLAEVIKQLRE